VVCSQKFFGLISTTFDLYIEMAFYMLIGLIFVGILNEVVSRAFVAKHTGTKGLLPVIKAALFGIPLPLCSCGVLPMTMFMRLEGAGKGATASFLLSTPQTGIDSIIATYGLLGPVFAIFRPVAAFVSGVLTGRVIDLLDKDEDKTAHNKDDASEEKSCCSHDEPEEKESCCCSHDEPNEEESCCCSHDEPEEKESCCCSHDEPEEEISCCSHDSAPKSKNSFEARLKRMYSYGFKTFLDDIAGHFLFGIIIAGMIAYFLPADLAERFNISDGVLGMLLMIVIGLPMYICATSSIPIAAAFILKGFSPGTAFVFLAVGPATNAASIAVISKVLGKRNTAIYIALLSITAVFAGLLLDYIFVALGINAMAFVSGEHSHEVFSEDLKLAGAVIFSIAFLGSITRNFKKLLRKK
jgi:uncharacterized membrane protein YraQ (UPF0718 family)